MNDLSVPAVAAVTGTTGTVGSAVVRALRERNFGVSAPGKSQERLGIWSDLVGVTPVPYDLSRQGPVPDVLRIWIALMFSSIVRAWPRLVPR